VIFHYEIKQCSSALFYRWVQKLTVERLLDVPKNAREKLVSFLGICLGY